MQQSVTNIVINLHNVYLHKYGRKLYFTSFRDSSIDNTNSSVSLKIACIKRYYSAVKCQQECEAKRSHKSGNNRAPFLFGIKKSSVQTKEENRKGNTTSDAYIKYSLTKEDEHEIQEIHYRRILQASSLTITSQKSPELPTRNWHNSWLVHLL